MIEEYKIYKNYNKKINPISGDDEYERTVEVFDNEMFRGSPSLIYIEEISLELYNSKPANEKPDSARRANIDKKQFLQGLEIEEQRILSRLINKPENKTIIKWYFSDGQLSVIEKNHIVAILNIEKAEDGSISDLVEKVIQRLESLNYA